ncbi:PfkB family carbohydrate kinase [Paraburkholderia rhynchosiae]|uniref:PfkB family carbohydrate kinase n=1 Tax=Paraburkholderia rhynchosiae TaxID=487049 RepID=UPI001FC96C9B|nr:PfkB family carbohydrate kinase [Paraburkholderia rhynchosiae]
MLEAVDVHVAGGAANVVVNTINLGARTTLLSVAGDDQDGRALQSLLESRNVHCTFLRGKPPLSSASFQATSRSCALTSNSVRITNRCFPAAAQASHLSVKNSH